MHLGLVLLYVGAVLFLNGLWLMAKIEDKEIWVINVFSGLIALSVAAYAAFSDGADAGSTRAAALTMLFSITYFWVAINRFSNADGRGLGWFSLFVAITIVPVTISALQEAGPGFLNLLLALSWGIWAVLWFMYFLLLTLNKPILKATAWVTLLSGIVTGWIPGVIILQQMM